MVDVEKAQVAQDLGAEGPSINGFGVNTTATVSSEGLSRPKLSDMKHETPWINRLVLLPTELYSNEYGRTLKWNITILVSAAAAIDSIATNIFYRALHPQEAF